MFMIEKASVTRINHDTQSHAKKSSILPLIAHAILNPSHEQPTTHTNPNTTAAPMLPGELSGPFLSTAQHTLSMSLSGALSLFHRDWKKARKSMRGIDRADGIPTSAVHPSASRADMKSKKKGIRKPTPALAPLPASKPTKTAMPSLHRRLAKGLQSTAPPVQVSLMYCPILYFLIPRFPQTLYCIAKPSTLLADTTATGLT